MSTEALSRLSEILESGGDVDDLLRAAVAALVADPSIVWAGIPSPTGGGLGLFLLTAGTHRIRVLVEELAAQLGRERRRAPGRVVVMDEDLARFGD